MTDHAGTVVRRLVGVYDADHTLRGELRYWVGARLGRAHCALCDISHGRFRTKSAWQEYRAGLGVAFDTFHRDDQPEGTRALGAVPLVAAETDRGFVALLDADALERCDGSVGRLASAIDVAVARHQLIWPARATEGRHGPDPAGEMVP